VVTLYLVVVMPVIVWVAQGLQVFLSLSLLLLKFCRLHWVRSVFVPGTLTRGGDELYHTKGSCVRPAVW